VSALDAAPGGKTPGPRPRHSEIATRVASALVLAAVALAAVVASPWTFAVLVIGAGVIVAWEWGRLVRGTEFDSIAWVQAVTVAAIVISVALGRPEIAALAFLVALAIIGFLSRASSHLAWSIAGMAYAGLPAFALVWLRSDKTLGAAALLYLLAVAWTTDSTSYAAGRLIGGPKLAPAISPRKTWAGLIVGTIAPALIGYAGALLLSGTSGTRLALVSVVIAAACQVGDLSESAVKRTFGAKDMSHLIPGHGGLVDRIDGLLFAALAAALIALRDPANPGRGLLIW
jgi:phosphatidate cytidylyltransferase